MSKQKQGVEVGAAGDNARKPGRIFYPLHPVDQHQVFRHSQNASTQAEEAAVGGSSALPEGIWKGKDGTYDCRACKRFGLNSLQAVQGHCSGSRHKAAVLLDNEKAEQERMSNAPRILIKSDGVYDEKKRDHSISAKVGNGPKTITFTLTNKSANSVFQFKQWPEQIVTDEFQFCRPEVDGALLGPSDQMKLRLVMKPKVEAVHAFKIFFHFYDKNRGLPWVESCDVKISFINNLIEELSNTGGQYVNQRPKHSRSRQYYGRGSAEPGLPLPGLADRDKLERTRSLPWSDMPRFMHQFINDGLVMKKNHSLSEKEELEVYKGVLEEGKLSFHNYQKYMEAVLYMEEHQTTVDMDMYFMEKARLRKHGWRGLFSLEVPGLAENRPSVLRGDHLYVRKYIGPDEYEKKEYQGIVHEVQMTRVFLGFSKNFFDKFYEGMEFCVRFGVNRVPMRLQHRSLTLKDSDESDLENVLFPTADTARTHGMLTAQDTQLRFFSRNPEPNPEQQRAIRHIVSGTSRPAPYIIFGPPGTGKTFTMVEAMKQVHAHIEGSCILACAPSNSAADLIAERLLDHLQPRQVFRMNAFSRNVSTIPDKIKSICNVDGAGDTCFPQKDDLDKKGIRIYVTTLITAGRLVSARFERDYFTHVFVDEASHSTEPETLVSIAGLLYANDKPAIGKQLVLAGDPKQLGPILRSPYAKKFGLDVSLMERLMSNPLYQRRSSPGTQDNLYYDPLLITKLIRNYRSHEAILRVPNRLFYNSELEPQGLPELTHMMCGWEHLPNKDMPLIFHAIIGEDLQEKNSPSFFNAMEVNIVINYVNLLVNKKGPKGTTIKESHIGIIAPYRKQVQKIQGELKKQKLVNIKVGCVEEFQGQERQVIIVSTVRSNPRYLNTDTKFGIGFVQNDKRFNVAVTRPKALLIVIGNPNTLRHNYSWNEFVQLCLDNRCMVDAHLDRSEDDDQFNKLKEQLSLLRLNDDVEESTDLEMLSTLNNEVAVNRGNHI